MNDKYKSNNEEIVFKGFKKHPYLFIIGILIMLLGTSAFLFLTPIGWIILFGFYDVIKRGTIFYRIIYIVMFIFYIFALLTVVDSFCDD